MFPTSPSPKSDHIMAVLVDDIQGSQARSMAYITKLSSRVSLMASEAQLQLQLHLLREWL